MVGKLKSWTWYCNGIHHNRDKTDESYISKLEMPIMIKIMTKYVFYVVQWKHISPVFNIIQCKQACLIILANTGISILWKFRTKRVTIMMHFWTSISRKWNYLEIFKQNSIKIQSLILNDLLLSHALHPPVLCKDNPK